MKVFIAGATGVIGLRSIPLLRAAGHDVTAVGRTPAKRDELDRLGARAIGVDLFSADDVAAAVRGHDAIINVATAVPSTVRGLLPGGWRAMDRVRREVSANLAAGALASDVRIMIQESFAPIYADAGDAWIDEGSRVSPSRYNRSVLDAESAAARMTAEGRAGVVLRFGLLYGPGDEMTQKLVDGIRQGMMPIFGAPRGYMSWLHQDDAARAVAASLTLGAGIYNVVDNEPMRRQDIARGMASKLGVKVPKMPPTWSSHLLGSVGDMLGRSLRISNRKLRDAAGWTAGVPNIVTGLGEML